MQAATSCRVRRSACLGVIMWSSRPNISDVLSPSVPTDRQIGKRLQAGIDGKHLGQTDDHRISRGWSLAAEKLPSVIICVVSDMKHRCATSDNAAECEHCAIRWLVEFPRSGHGV